jgi:predicted esterase
MRPAIALAILLAAPSLARGEDGPPRRGELVEGLRCRSDPSQTYTLYLPHRYEPTRRWPALLILDPRGRSVRAAELFRDAAEEYGWVLLSSNDTRSDGPMEPNVKALQALWPEVHVRYATDPDRVYLAGFSGGAMIAWEVGRRTGRVAGVIASGGRWLPDHFKEPISFPCFGAAGDLDFNYDEMKKVHARLREWGTPERLEIFEGPHSWMPAPLARRAVEWLELQAMKRNLRPRDDALVSRLLAEDLARDAQLQKEGRVLDAQRAYAATAATFEGLAPTADARREARRLAALPDTARAIDEEREWDRYEEKTLHLLEQANSELLAADPPFLLGAFRARYRMDELLQRAEKKGYEAVVARRLLYSLATQTGFYMTRELMQKGDYVRAEIALALATEAVPDRPEYWYNLACCRAHVGDRDRALDALEKAFATGFANRAHAAADADLESLRGEPRFQAVVGGAAGTGQSP